MIRTDVTVVGGGIVGLATAWTLAQRYPQLKIAVMEKEAGWGNHQTRHNSGVLHSGIYYAPGSLKARLARDGNQRMADFCAEHQIPFERCGKLIVAVDGSELPGLRKLAERARANRIEVEELTPEAARAYEPHLRCLAALRLPSTGILDYGAVCDVLVRLLASKGAALHLRTTFMGVQSTSEGLRIATSQGDWLTRRLIMCGGLQSDRLARQAGQHPALQIIPFRGEYHELRPERRSLVKHLIYPVPDPDLPFLGVHFTRGIDGSVHVGPNAVLATAREGYRRRDFNAKDVWEMVTFPGFWRMARRWGSYGIGEWKRSLSLGALTRALQRMVPELTAEDLVPSGAGVRAQAVWSDGRLVDDFYLIESGPILHVCNAPSPAATASLGIADHIVASFKSLSEIL